MNEDRRAQGDLARPDADRPRFVIVGCSRSGTGYIAKLLWKVGVACGHEKYFDIWRVIDRPSPSIFLEGFPRLQGEASFLAVPFVAELPAGTVVLHQLRHPVAVTRSHMGIRFFAEPFVRSEFLAENHPDITRFIAEHCPAVFADADELGRSLRFWAFWNRLAERGALSAGLPYLRYRVEELDRGLLRRITALLGADPTDETIDRALRSVAKTESHRPRDESVSWEAIPPSAAKADVARLAARYGYDIRPEASSARGLNTTARA
jgi:hypothetical protein